MEHHIAFGKHLRYQCYFVIPTLLTIHRYIHKPGKDKMVTRSVGHLPDLKNFRKEYLIELTTVDGRLCYQWKSPVSKNVLRPFREIDASVSKPNWRWIKERIRLIMCWPRVSRQTEPWHVSAGGKLSAHLERSSPKFLVRLNLRHWLSFYDGKCIFWYTLLKRNARKGIMRCISDTLVT